MGEVYRAHDTTLNRDVAIKILPSELATDSDRLARFRREAQALAALNHPNIATIHGIEESTGVRALVLELIEGPTLADWITARHEHSTTNEAVAIARQIAEGLDAAHERGIVHRDLKPANVKMAADGRVKILDFGLAKVHEVTTPSARTVNALHTDAGVVLGTVPYMSPEQARGTLVDRRTDIWAFGCILYELLTGRQAFPSGETASDTLASVLVRDPDWTALPSTTPPRLRALVMRCLQKDPRERLRDIGDAFVDLKDPAITANAVTEAPPRRRRELVSAAVALLALATVAAVGFRALREPPRDAMVFTVQAPQGGRIGAGQPLSPDGRTLAFVAAARDGTPMVWVRPLSSLTPRALEGTENASFLFWSADSQQIAFFADDRLSRIPVAGGSAQLIAVVAGALGGAWNSQGVILIGTRGPLLRVSAAGGEPVPATKLDVAARDQWHVAPDFLPDGRHFLFTVMSGGLADRQAFVGELDSDRRLMLAGVREGARYSATGHVLFTRDSSLVAQRFDSDTLTLTGEPFLVGASAARGVGDNLTPFSASTNGSLAFLALADTETELTWFDRTGLPLGVAGPRDVYLNQDLSPDGTRVAIDLRDTRGNVDAWVLDVATGIKSRITSHEDADYTPMWSPDGESVAFTSYRAGVGNLYRREIGVVADETLIQASTAEQRMADWSKDGRYWVYEQNLREAGAENPSQTDLWAIPNDDPREPIQLTNTPFEEHNPRLSPDTRWIAYESNESGQDEVYVQSFPRPGFKQQVSAGGGETPVWRSDGSELFYLTRDGGVMAISVTVVDGRLRFGAPTRLFRANIAFTGIQRVLSVSGDGRFLLNVVPADRAPSTLVVLQNWVAATQ